MIEISYQLIFYWILSVALSTIALNILSTIIHRRMDSFLPKIFNWFRRDNEKDWRKRMKHVAILVNSRHEILVAEIQRAAFIGKAILYLLIGLVCIYNSAEVVEFTYFAQFLIWKTAVFIIGAVFVLCAMNNFMKSGGLNLNLELAREFKDSGNLKELGEKGMQYLKEVLNAENNSEQNNDNQPKPESIEPKQDALPASSTMKQSMDKEHNSEI